MSEMSESEKQQAVSEARDVVASGPAGSSTVAREAALRRYLSAARYHELRREETEETEEATESDSAAEPGDEPQP